MYLKPGRLGASSGWERKLHSMSAFNASMLKRTTLLANPLDWATEGGSSTEMDRARRMIIENVFKPTHSTCIL
jgi:hypothetical protein